MISPVGFLSVAASIATAFFLALPAAAGPISQAPAVKNVSPPIIFFVAKGEANSCGEGCDTWIAAHGEFDSSAAARLKRLLARIGKRDLPIFFFSPGGNGREAMAIGRMMRERKMRVGVARTILSDCKDSEFSDSCNAMRRSDREVAASLNTLSMCASACVYAMLGGQTRDVSANAILAVHSSKIVLMRNGRRVPVKGALVAYAEKRSQVFEAEIDRYTKSMGIDSELLKVARSVPFESSRNLTREEIFKFGIDKRDAGDSGWTVQQVNYRTAATVTMFRRGWGGRDNFGLLRLALSCLPSGVIDIDYLARGSGGPWPTDKLVMVFDDERVEFKRFGDGRTSPVERASATMTRDAAWQLAKAARVSMALEGGEGATLQTQIGRAGLAHAMSEMLSRCGADQQQRASAE
jgi:hypothetical protein